MDTSALARNIPAYGSVGMARPAPQPSRTDLPPQNAVTPAVQVALSPQATLRRRSDAERVTNAQNDRERRFVNDPKSRDLVFRISDESSGSVVYQLPSEETLKLRAYNESLEQALLDREAEKRAGRP
jgi:hypothetical protein